MQGLANDAFPQALKALWITADGLTFSDKSPQHRLFLLKASLVELLDVEGHLPMRESRSKDAKKKTQRFFSLPLRPCFFAPLRDLCFLRVIHRGKRAAKEGSASAGRIGKSTKTKAVCFEDGFCFLFCTIIVRLSRPWTVRQVGPIHIT